MKDQIFVVEGRNDVTRLKQVFPSINVVSVNGSAINEDVVSMLVEKALTHEVVICTDPDYPGLRIRSFLERKIPNASHIFIERNIARSKNGKKLGLEHLSNEEIKETFNQVLRISDKENTKEVSLSFLYDLNIVGDNSKDLRNKVAKSLNLGHVNGKTLLKRINSFNISEEKILEVVKVIKEGDGLNG